MSLIEILEQVHAMFIKVREGMTRLVYFKENRVLTDFWSVLTSVPHSLSMSV